MLILLQVSQLFDPKGRQVALVRPGAVLWELVKHVVWMGLCRL